MLIATLVLATTLATPIPVDTARRAFDEIRLASEEEGGKLWGRPLYGPTLFVDRQTRFAVANQADANGALKADGGVFTGTLPNDVILANTATNWSGVRWTMVLWDSVGTRVVSRRRLLLHESFHRIQTEAGFAAGEGNNAQLDTVDGRYWLLLELRALAKALRNDERPQATADALAFRAKRRALFDDAAKNERSLENNEGLAEYTGVALRGTTDEETRQSVARRLDALSRDDSFVRSFAYSTGPAYGLLLDLAAPGWTRTYKAADDLGDTLARAAKATPAADADGRAAAYGGAQLRAEEEKRDREHRELVASMRARLVDGPTLTLPMTDAHYGFDPRTVVPLGGSGNAYPALHVTAPWGAITADARITNDWSQIVVAAGDRAKLTLADGWRVEPGDRPGDLRVVK
jgi:hypothetical protein